MSWMMTGDARRTLETYWKPGGFNSFASNRLVYPSGQLKKLPMIWGMSQSPEGLQLLRAEELEGLAIQSAPLHLAVQLNIAEAHLAGHGSKTRKKPEIPQKPRPGQP